MIVIIGLVILAATVIAGVAGVLTNGSDAHAVGHFAVFGYHMTGSTGTLFLYGVVVGALGLLGLSLPDVPPRTVPAGASSAPAG